MSRRAQREALLEDARAFVDQRVERALDDLLVAIVAPRDARRRAPIVPMSSTHLGIRHRLAVVVVAIPALAGLLARTGPSRTAGRRPAACARRVASNWPSSCARARRRRARPCRPRRRCPSPCRSRSARGPPARASRRPRPGTAPRTCRGTSCGCRRSPGRCRRRRRPCRAAWRSASAVASTACSVAVPRTISTRRITSAGLKKCRPTTDSGRAVALAISSMSSVDVLRREDAARLGDGDRARRRPAS